MRPIDESPNTGRRLFNGVRFKPAVIFSSLFFLLLAATTAFGQYTTARLSGTVQDNSGAAVPGASVTVEQTATGYQQQVKTGTAGEYLFPSLPVGDYQLTVSVAGFNTYVQKGIGLTVGQAASQKVVLTIGAITQQVTVDANSNQVTTDDAAITQVIGQDCR
jgi:hypothetical protein